MEMAIEWGEKNVNKVVWPIPEPVIFFLSLRWILSYRSLSAYNKLVCDQLPSTAQQQAIGIQKSKLYA